METAARRVAAKQSGVALPDDDDAAEAELGQNTAYETGRFTSSGDQWVAQGLPPTRSPRTAVSARMAFGWGRVEVRLARPETTALIFGS